MAAVVACAGLLALVADPAEATAKFTVTAKVSNASPVPGAAVAFTGAVKPQAKRKIVQLQRRVNGIWKTVARARTSYASRYRIVVTPPTGTSRYRVCKARTASTRAGCSLTLTVRPQTYRWLSVRQNPYWYGDFVLTDSTVVLDKSYPNSFETRLDSERWPYPGLAFPLGRRCDKMRLGLAYVRDGELPGGTGSMYVLRSGGAGGTPAIMGTKSSPTVLWFDDIDVRGVDWIRISSSLGPTDENDGRDWPVLGILNPQVHCLGWPPRDN